MTAGPASSGTLRGGQSVGFPEVDRVIDRLRTMASAGDRKKLLAVESAMCGPAVA